MAKIFGAHTTADEVLDGIDLTGKRILITGASAGIGVETARALVAHGADVVGAVRDLAKGERATAGVRAAADAGPGSFELIELDLGALASVRRCADALNADGRPFDIVIANAGVMATPFTRTVDGFEIQFGTNHLGHFTFLNRIASLIPPGGRLVNLASSGHRISDVNIDDPDYETTSYNPWSAYGRSKTANILFMIEFDRRHRDRGVRACAVHPGQINTELLRHITPEIAQSLIDDLGIDPHNISPTVEKTVQQGAATSVWAATADIDQVGGRYCEDCGVAALDDENKGFDYGLRSYAIDAGRAKTLWTKSEAMVGETF